MKDTYEEVRVVHEEKKISYMRKGKLIEYVRKARIDVTYRDLVTGQFTKKVEGSE